MCVCIVLIDTKTAGQILIKFSGNLQFSSAGDAMKFDSSKINRFFWHAAIDV